MYKNQEHQLMMPDDFFLPFGGVLNKEDRWVILAQIIPWWKVEEHYAATFKKATAKGTKPFSARLALGALIIQQRQGTSDRETVLQITGNPYMQYFLGLPAFQQRPPFHHSMMTRFRKRLKKRDINQINEWLVLQDQKATQAAEGADQENEHNDHQDPKPPIDSTRKTNTPAPSSAKEQKESENKGKLLLDATCTSADIAYPTDVSLLDQTRRKLEMIIDVLYQPLRKRMRIKPRTYRKKAHRAYLSIAKQRRPGAVKRRKAVKQQLDFVKRDLKTIEKIATKMPLTQLPADLYRYLLVAHECYRQQDWMYRHHEDRIDDRIVSLSQPHVRPIVRDKARARVEFGAKVAISLVNGDALIEELSWDNFNEGTTLQTSVETYRRHYGFYPEAVLADTLYRNRKNLNYCKLHYIRLSGPRLGRKPKDKQVQKTERQTDRRDFKGRIPIEGKFGEGKRRFGLNRIRTMLRESSETAIALKFLVMNLERRLRASLRFFCFFRNIRSLFFVHSMT